MTSPAPEFSAHQLASQLGQHPPTDQQAAVVEAPLAPLLVVAGAGSGKTETMANRVVWLVANKYARPEEILGLTFTRKAAAELSSRIRGRLAQLTATTEEALVIGEPTVSTYNSYAGRVVAEHGLRAGFEPTARLLTEANTWQLASSIVTIYDGDMSMVDWAPPTVTAAVLDLAGQLAEHLVDADALVEWTERLVGVLGSFPPGPRQRLTIRSDVQRVLTVQQARAQLLPLVAEYTARKRALEAMDYGDQVARAAVVARDHPDVGRIERARYKAVLLDEYQDTSHAQLVLLRSLFGRGHPVTAVGDPCQSIYAWRGASAGNLRRFPAHFPRRDGSESQVRPLSVSWRNGEHILTVANQLSAPLRAGDEQVAELEPAPSKEAYGTVAAALLPTVDDEARWVAGKIAGYWHVPDQTPPTAAVLVRTRAQFDRIAAALRALDVPVEVVGLGGLLATAEVRDVVATLHVLVDPTAGGALLRLLSGARWRLGPRDLDALGRRARELAAPYAEDGVVTEAHVERSIVEALDDLGASSAFSSAGYTRLARLRNELRGLRSRTNQPLPDLVAEVERTLGLDVEVAVTRDWLLARGHLDAFGDVAAEFADAAEQPTVTAFLAYLEAADQRERGLAPGQVEVTAGAVQVLTVHAAKGLEWDVVAVPGLVTDVFPAPSTTSDTWLTGLGVLPFTLRGDADDLPALDLGGVDDQKDASGALDRFADAWRVRGRREERRLAYVAVTRARHALFCSGSWWQAGTKRARGPSEFLREIAGEDGAAAEVWADEPHEDVTNPLEDADDGALWPYDPLGDRRDLVEEAAALVVEMNSAPLTDSERAAGEDWAREATLLLAERERYRRRGPQPVELPSHLTVSQLVTLRRDPAELARLIRRPVPREPAPLARRGTAFHTWLERRFGAERLLDIDELPGAADSSLVPESDLELLQAKFLASEWADRTPEQVEVPFATMLGGAVVRGRMDAVFRSESGWEVVDWKTGARPRDKAGRTASAVQLAAYRLAWASLAGVPLSQVGAAFHYVRSGTTVRPVDLLDAEGLAALITAVPPAP